MKKQILRKVFLSILGLSLFTQFSQSQHITHGSMLGSGLSLYAQHNGSPTDYGTVVSGVTFDYKVVTVNGESWAWTNLTGANIGGATWSSQLRYYNLSMNKTENNLLNRVSGTQQTYGSSSSSSIQHRCS